MANNKKEKKKVMWSKIIFLTSTFIILFLVGFFVGYQYVLSVLGN